MKDLIKRFYMHTIDGKPASFCPEGHIVYSYSGRWQRRGIRLATSVAQIHREQKASDAWRLKKGFLSSADRYGFVRVDVSLSEFTAAARKGRAT